jgi:hypothetical protein
VGIALDLFAQGADGARRHANVRVHQTVSRAVSNGCGWRAELDGSLGVGPVGAADLRVTAEVRCPNGQAARTPARRVRVTGSSGDEIARALERAARVTMVDGGDRCAYAPSLRVRGARVESTAVFVACLPGDDDRAARGGAE